MININRLLANALVEVKFHGSDKLYCYYVPSYIKSVEKGNYVIVDSPATGLTSVKVERVFFDYSRIDNRTRPIVSLVSTVEYEAWLAKRNQLEVELNRLEFKRLQAEMLQEIDDAPQVKALISDIRGEQQ